jgi:hypothetical protein
MINSTGRLNSFYRDKEHKFSLIVLVFLLINTLKAKDIFFPGRFWAEEGTLFWANLIETKNSGEPISHVLFYFPPLAGYLHFYTNIAMTINFFLPTPVHSFTTVFFALIMNLAPPFIIWKFYVGILTFRTQIALVILLLFGPISNVGEVYMNTLNSQVFMGLSVALLIPILHLQKISKSQITIISLFILLGCLHTGYVCVLGLYYIVKSLYLRIYKQENLNKMILTSFILGSLIQLWSRVNYNHPELIYDRRIQINFFDFIDIVYYSIINSLGGNYLMKLLPELRFNLVVVVSFVFVVTYLLARVNKGGKFNIHSLNAISLDIVIIYLILVVFIGLFAVDGLSVGRYSVIPAFLLSILVVMNLVEGFRIFNYKSINAFIILCVSFVYFLNYQDNKFYFEKNENCDSWLDQIRLVKLEKSSGFDFWPCYDQKIWTLEVENIRPTIMPFQQEHLKTKMFYR